MNTHEPDEEPWAVFELSSPGWFRVTAADDLDGELYIGTALDDNDEPTISGIVLQANPGFEWTTAQMRELPLARIKATLKTTPVLAEWVRTAPRSVDPIRQLQDEADEGPKTELFRSRGAVRPRLTRPGPRHNGEFYAEVAAAYKHYVQASNKPAVEIAHEADVPVATARRWINNARELGLLEKGQRGRAI